MERIRKTLAGLLTCMILLSGMAFAETAETFTKLEYPELGVVFQLSKEREQAFGSGQYALAVEDSAIDQDRYTYVHIKAYYMKPEMLEGMGLIAEYMEFLQYLDENGVPVYDLVVVREDLMETYAADADVTVTELGRKGNYAFEIRRYAVEDAQEDAVLGLMVSDAEKITEWAQFSEPIAMDQQFSASMDGMPMEGAVDLDGQPVPEDLYARSTLTMVNIWGTFCSPCIQEMPELGELSREYEQERFQIVGVVSDVSAPGDSNAELAKTIIEKTAADFLHVIPSQAMLYGPMSSMQYVPTTLFIDATGAVVGEMVVGSHSKADWQKLIDERLALVEGSAGN